MHEGGPHVVVAMRVVVMVVAVVVMVVMLVVGVMMGVVVPVIVACVVMVMRRAAQQPRARQVYQQPRTGDRDGLRIVDRDRREQALDRRPADQQCDHGQHDRTGIAGEIAELAGAEGEARILRMSSRVGVGECGQQQRAGMRAHVQPVGDQRDRAEHQPAADFRQHHDRAQQDHGPGPALVLAMHVAKEHVPVRRLLDRRHGTAHRRLRLPLRGNIG